MKKKAAPIRTVMIANKVCYYSKQGCRQTAIQAPCLKLINDCVVVTVVSCIQCTDQNTVKCYVNKGIRFELFGY